MPINAHPDFLNAESEYHQAETKEQKIRALKKMISLAPKHKGAENLRKQLKRRLAKLKYTKEKQDKSGKHHDKGIKKEPMQAVIIGKTNSGKSSLLKFLTKANPNISSNQFTTKNPLVGMMPFHSTQIQLIENPAIDSDFYDRGLPHTADTLIILVNTLEDIQPILDELTIHKGKRLIIFNNINNLDPRKIESTLSSKKFDFIITNLDKSEHLKEKIFSTFNKIRVYTKPSTPGNKKSPRPIIFEPGATVKDVAEKILKGFSEKIKQTKIWGPSSKFPGQVVGLNHKLKDLDIVEFKTK